MRSDRLFRRFRGIMTVRETVEIIDVEDVPLQYYPGNTNRVKVKAAGDLK